MAGTNDIAHNTGPMTAQDSQNNLMAMCEIAQAHKLRVVLGSVPPASKYWWRPEAQPKPEALALNEWMRGYAKQIGAKYADYAAVLTDAQRQREAGACEGRGASDAGGLRGDAAGGRGRDSVGIAGRQSRAGAALAIARAAAINSAMATGWAQGRRRTGSDRRDGQGRHQAREEPLAVRAVTRVVRGMRREDSRGAPRGDSGRAPVRDLPGSARSRGVHNSGYNRRGSKDSQLR